MRAGGKANGETALHNGVLEAGGAVASPDRADRRGERLRVAVSRARRDPSRPAMLIVLVFVTVVMLYPFYFMVLNSLRSEQEYVAGSGFSGGSWVALFRAIPAGRELLNSTVVSVSAIAIILVVSCLAGFGFAKLGFRGGRAILLGVTGCMMIPSVSIIVPEYVNLAHLGLVNSYLGAVLVYAALGTPFAVFLMTAYFRGVPDEVVEAALCDGAGYIAALRRVVLPMARPALVTVAVLQFIQIWDDLLIGLLFLQEPGNRTITVGLAVLSSGRVFSVPVLMAGSLFSALPAIVVYLVFQRYLISGLTMGMGK